MFIIKPELTKCNNCRWSKCSATGITWSLQKSKRLSTTLWKDQSHSILRSGRYPLRGVGRTCLLKPASSSMAVRRSTSPAWAPCSIWTSESFVTMTLKSCFGGDLSLQRVKVPVEKKDSIHPWAMRQSIDTRFTHSPPTSAPRTFTNTDYDFVLWSIYMPIWYTETIAG